MGQIIAFEQLKIEREQKIRTYALKHFPWEEMDRIQLYILQPLSEGWSKQRQIIVLEAAYRLVFDAYFLGLQLQIKRRKRKKNKTEEYDSFFEQDLCLLVEQIVSDFLIDRLFSRHKQESIQILFHSLAQEWFLRGFMREEPIR